MRDATEEYRRTRASLKGRLKELTISGLRKNIASLRRGLEQCEDPKLRERLAHAEEALRDFEGGAVPVIEPTTFLGRDERGRIGGLLGLFYRGSEFDVLSRHPASIGLTGNEGEDSALRDLIFEDIEAFFGEHGLLDLYRHLTAGCPQSVCTWHEDIGSLFARSKNRKKALDDAEKELDRLRGLEWTVEDQQKTIDNLYRDAELSRKEKDGLSAALAESDRRLEEALAECTELQRENARLRLEASETAENKTEAEKAIIDLSLLLYKRDNVVQWAKDGELHDNLNADVKFLVTFWRKEKRMADFRDQAGKGLSDEERGLIEADRAQLRDVGYPKFVNRRDLVRRLRRVDKATLGGLLAYRDGWDAKLPGRTIHQDTFEKLAAGLSEWKQDPRINGLRTLARASGVDRSTLRMYHRLGLVDLGWCIGDAPVAGEIRGRSRRRARADDRLSNPR